MNILIAEDDTLVALDMEMHLVEHGHRVVGTARTLEEALELLDRHAPDLVLIDINLADGTTGPELAERASRRGARCVFATADPSRVLEGRFANCPVLRKPLLDIDLKRLMSYLGGPYRSSA